MDHNGGDANNTNHHRLLAFRAAQEAGEVRLFGLPPRTVLSRVRAAKQTKTNVDSVLRPRGPGANEGNYILRPHPARFHPSNRMRLRRRWVIPACTP